MYRTHTCGELDLSDKGRRVILSGWIHRSRDLGGMTFIDLRDRYGKTQLVFNTDTDPDLYTRAGELGREYVIRIEGVVEERSNKNPKMATGDIEIIVDMLTVLNTSSIPPFTLEENTDGGDELRMKYRYLDLRREPVKQNMIHRHRLSQEVRKYLDSQGFIEIETPVLIKSTPEGARDFVVPSRTHPGDFYALPQSPQTFKQLLMVSGFDKYFQIVKCFRDEDLRADRQPEFTQIDCEMSFVEQDDILDAFEGLTVHLFKTVKKIDIKEKFIRMPYHQAMSDYGTDKPDLRFDMKISGLGEGVKGRGFRLFDESEYTGGIVAGGCAAYSRKDLDKLTDFVKRPQIGAGGLIWVKYNIDGSFKSSVDKFFTSEDLQQWAALMNASPGDLMLILAGDRLKTLSALSALRLEMGERLGLRDPAKYNALWVTDFPLLEWDGETERYYAMHHPFTSPKAEDIDIMESDPAGVRANAYDLVINGVEIGGGSVRIHDAEIQKKMFRLLGFTDEEARAQFGFLLDAFKYGAPPHGGIAFGFDRLVSLFAGSETIRDFIAFPKNNAGRDVMIDSPSPISGEQLDELHLDIKNQPKE